jgi:hypothetical protein
MEGKMGLPLVLLPFVIWPDLISTVKMSSFALMKIEPVPSAKPAKSNVVKGSPIEIGIITSSSITLHLTHSPMPLSGSVTHYVRLDIELA